MASNQTKLNGMNPASHDAVLGTKLDQIITLLNAIRADHNAHTHDGVTVGAGSTGVPDVGLTTAPAVDVLD